MEKIMVRIREQETLGLKGYNICIGLSLLFGLMITALGTYLFRDSLGMMFNAHPLIFSILYLIVGLGCGYMARTAESNGGAILGYTLLTLATGALLSACVPYEKTGIVINAAITTAIILVVMIAVATIFPQAFTGLGKILFTALISFIVAELFMLIIFRTEPAIMDWLCIGLFTIYIGYDWAKGMEYPKTVKFAVITATQLYLDVINIFIRILSRSSSSRRNK